ncbi:MAG: nicotinate-nucleotide adenylyltransferase [Lachnospiraceae bacterium]|nr:nicotinate-nucleotide adenylyltransferase [Lachnospiraceae bacterium]
MKRIGIIGGTFNPIHNGHLAIAKQAKEQFLLEKVLFIPSGVPYMKDLQAVLPVETRCEMTAAAIAGKPYFELSDIEAADAAQGKNTYTYETLQKLRTADPDAVYYFILGADSLYDMEQWKNPDLIFQYCTVLAAVRGEERETSLRQKLTGQIQYLQGKYHASIAMLEMEGMQLSSTRIRKCIKEGKSIQNMVPEAVAAYIQKHHLYE